MRGGKGFGPRTGGLVLLAMIAAGCSGSGNKGAVAPVSLPATSTPSASASLRSAPGTSPTPSASLTGSITSAVPGSPTDSSSAPVAAVAPSPGTPDETVQNYFTAINKKNWPTVWALGGKNVNHSYQSMIDGYAHTVDDNAYVYAVTKNSVRLALLARSDTGITSLYAGTYTVGSGVITSGSLSLQDQVHDSRAAIGDFAADWIGHGRDITIAAGGIGVLAYRAYVDCSQTTSKPCDDLIGNEIYDGGLTIFQITSVTGHTAAATALFTTEARKVPLTLERQPSAGTITINTVDAPFCDPAADDAGTCGL